MKRLNDPKAAEMIFDNLKSYEILRTLDTNRLKERGEVRSMLTGQELSARAQQHISRMYRDLGNEVVMKGLTFRHDFSALYRS